MSNEVHVAGVGHDPLRQARGQRALQRDGRRGGARWRWPTPGSTTARSQQAYVGYVYGDSTCGQRALYEVGMTGIPVVNVNNNCSTGSTALFLARQAVAERRGRLRAGAGLRADGAGRARRRSSPTGPSPFDRFDDGTDGAGRHARRAARAALLRRRRPGAHAEVRHRAWRPSRRIRAKASRHAANNPLALFRKVVTRRRGDGLADAVPRRA